jgi:hypothetical protein
MWVWIKNLVLMFSRGDRWEKFNLKWIWMWSRTQLGTYWLQVDHVVQARSIFCVACHAVQSCKNPCSAVMQESVHVHHRLSFTFFIGKLFYDTTLGCYTFELDENMWFLRSLIFNKMRIYDLKSSKASLQFTTYHQKRLRVSLLLF